VVGLNTIIQTLVKEELRGRVISMYSLSFMALAPFGNLFWGQITHIYGIKITLMLASAWVIFSNFIFYKNMKNIKRNILLYKTQERITNFDII
ncbi:MAG: MFS transporter, partial [Endomicrobia bacterium]|nr:MFS transporter [Endomicrobiia bacterium]